MLFLKDLTLGQEQAFKEREITFKVTFDLADLSEGFDFIFGNGDSFLGWSETFYNPRHHFLKDLCNLSWILRRHQRSQLPGLHPYSRFLISGTL